MRSDLILTFVIFQHTVLVLVKFNDERRHSIWLNEHFGPPWKFSYLLWITKIKAYIAFLMFLNSNSYEVPTAIHHINILTAILFLVYYF